MPVTIIAEYAIGKALDGCISFGRRLLARHEVALTTTRKRIQDSLSYHVTAVDKWSAEVSFLDAKEPRSTTQIYVPLDTFVRPQRLRVTSEEIIPRMSLTQALGRSGRHAVVLGHAGAGKTTSMKILARKVLQKEEVALRKFSFPVVLRLRESRGAFGAVDVDAQHRYTQQQGGLIINALASVFGLHTEPPNPAELSLPEEEKRRRERVLSKFMEARLSVVEQIVVKLLNELGVLLLLDGLDELPTQAQRDIALHDIQVLVRQLDSSLLIVTSRTGEFTYHVEGAEHLEICPLDNDQIASFAKKWLRKEDEVQDFLAQLHRSPFVDTAIRPLALAHLCAFYMRAGKIPDKPKTLYHKIVHLLLADWDEQRSVVRASRYASFDPYRKFEFLCHLAYELTLNYGLTQFSSTHLVSVYQRICADYGLPEREQYEVSREIESHTGLLIEVGHSSYEFAHRSLQEYLTAEHLVRLPSIPEGTDLARLPNELAIGITISARPSEYLEELILRRLVTGGQPEEFFRIFATRLLQEKPDFRSSPEVLLSLVVLCSLVATDGRLSEPKDPPLSRSLECGTMFTQVMRMWPGVDPSATVRLFYSPGRTSRQYGDLHLVESHSTLKGRPLPGRLWLPADTVREWWPDHSGNMATG